MMSAYMMDTYNAQYSTFTKVHLHDVCLQNTLARRSVAWTQRYICLKGGYMVNNKTRQDDSPDIIYAHSRQHSPQLIAIKLRVTKDLQAFTDVS